MVIYDWSRDFAGPALIMPKRYHIVNVSSPERLRAVADFNVAAAGARDVTIDVLARWWRVYPEGIRLAETGDGQIVAAVSLWPVRPRVFDALCVGRYTRTQLAKHDFDSHRGRRPHWFLSGAAVSPEFARSTKFLRSLLLEAVDDVRRAHGTFALSLCALAGDQDAERALRKSAFVHTRDGPHGAVYVLQAN